MSSNPPQLHLSIPPSTTSFKRSFDQFGFDLDSPVNGGGGSNGAAASSSGSSHGSGTSGGSSDGNERHKRARSSGPDNGSSTSQSSSQSSSTMLSFGDDSMDTDISASMANSQETHSSSSSSHSPFTTSLSLIGVTRAPEVPPRLPMPDLDDIGVEYTTAAESPSTAPSLPPILPVSDYNENYRLSLERFTTFDRHVSVLRDRSSPIHSMHEQQRPPTLPPMLPPIPVSSLIDDETEAAGQQTEEPPLDEQAIRDRLDSALDSLGSVSPLMPGLEEPSHPESDNRIGGTAHHHRLDDHDSWSTIGRPISPGSRRRPNVARERLELPDLRVDLHSLSPPLDDIIPVAGTSTELDYMTRYSPPADSPTEPRHQAFPMLRRVSSTSRARQSSAPRLSLHIGEESRRLAERRDSITSQPPPYTAEREWTSTTLPRYIAPQLTTREQQNEALTSSHNAVPPAPRLLLPTYPETTSRTEPWASIAPREARRSIHESEAPISSSSHLSNIYSYPWADSGTDSTDIARRRSLANNYRSASSSNSRMPRARYQDDSFDFALPDDRHDGEIRARSSRAPPEPSTYRHRPASESFPPDWGEFLSGPTLSLRDPMNPSSASEDYMMRRDSRLSRSQLSMAEHHTANPPPSRSYAERTRAESIELERPHLDHLFSTFPRPLSYTSSTTRDTERSEGRRPFSSYAFEDYYAQRYPYGDDISMSPPSPVSPISPESPPTSRPPAYAPPAPSTSANRTSGSGLSFRHLDTSSYFAGPFRDSLESLAELDVMRNRIHRLESLVQPPPPPHPAPQPPSLPPLRFEPESSSLRGALDFDFPFVQDVSTYGAASAMSNITDNRYEPAPRLRLIRPSTTRQEHVFHAYRGRTSPPPAGPSSSSSRIFPRPSTAGPPSVNAPSTSASARADERTRSRQDLHEYMNRQSHVAAARVAPQVTLEGVLRRDPRPDPPRLSASRNDGSDADSARSGAGGYLSRPRSYLQTPASYLQYLADNSSPSYVGDDVEDDLLLGERLERSSARESGYRDRVLAITSRFSRAERERERERDAIPVSRPLSSSSRSAAISGEISTGPSSTGTTSGAALPSRVRMEHRTRDDSPLRERHPLHPSRAAMRRRHLDDNLTNARPWASLTAEGRDRPRDSPSALMAQRLARTFHGSLFARSMGDYVRDEDFDTSYESLLSLSSVLGEARPWKIPAHIRESMPSGTYKDWANSDSDTRCPICLDDYNPTDIVLKLPDCGHWLHKDCVLQWLDNSHTCPICRKGINGAVRGSSTMPARMSAAAASRPSDFSANMARRPRPGHMRPVGPHRVNRTADPNAPSTSSAASSSGANATTSTTTTAAQVSSSASGASSAGSLTSADTEFARRRAARFELPSFRRLELPGTGTTMNTFGSGSGSNGRTNNNAGSNSTSTAGPSSRGGAGNGPAYRLSSFDPLEPSNGSGGGGGNSSSDPDDMDEDMF